MSANGTEGAPITLKAGLPSALAALIALIFIACCIGACDAGRIDSPASLYSASASGAVSDSNPSAPDFSLDEIPAYSGEATTEVGGNEPFFSEDDLSRSPFEEYSELDLLGRCGTAFAMIGPEAMPDSKRGSIGDVKPTGWKISKYDWVDGGYLFNRCHLIAFALAGENDNPLNLITGTRSMNVQGMLPYEERVGAYVKETSNHVLYRVTPVFDDDNLVASGVLMEAKSVEDFGRGVQFCVWCYNVEPGVVIDYATGDNWPGNPESQQSLAESGSAQASDSTGSDGARAASNGDEASASSDANAARAADSDVEAGVSAASDAVVRTYILNTNTHRFHYPSCASAKTIKDKNRQEFEGTRDDAIEAGYTPCGVCRP